MIAYVDTSVLVAILFNEPGAAVMARRLSLLSLVVSSPLLESELRAAAKRENQPVDDAQLRQISWVSLPGLSSHLARVFESGYLRGADAYHVATALHFFGDLPERTFLTLDATQREVAERVDLSTAWPSE